MGGGGGGEEDGEEEVKRGGTKADQGGRKREHGEHARCRRGQRGRSWAQPRKEWTRSSWSCLVHSSEKADELGGHPEPSDGGGAVTDEGVCTQRRGTEEGARRGREKEQLCRRAWAGLI